MDEKETGRDKEEKQTKIWKEPGQRKGRNISIDKKEHGPNSRNAEEETRATIRWKPKQRKERNTGNDKVETQT